MKLIIAGSRTFTDYQLLCQTLAPDRPHITQVITGGARGADQLGYRWAWKHQVKHQLFRADWERFGKSAGVRRNHQMAQAGDMVTRHGPHGAVHAPVGQTGCGHPHGWPGIKKAPDTCPGASPEFASHATAHELYLNPLA
jgi:YspA, cpYpsA-related SLOG family